MLSLNSLSWRNLSDAYGAATNVPDLLRELEAYPQKSTCTDEPYQSLRSSLCHQGDVYTASYAAVPHILELARARPLEATYDYLLLPTSIEIARIGGHGPKVPSDLELAYFGALRMIPAIVGSLAGRELDEGWCLACGAAIAVSNGHAVVAEAILELEGSAQDFLDWKFSQ